MFKEKRGFEKRRMIFKNKIIMDENEIEGILLKYSFGQ